MRQRIDKTQLMELSPEQQEKLGKWWKPQHGDHFITTGDEIFILADIGSSLWDIKDGGHDEKDCLPLLSIGQCIELLESHDQCINIVNAIHGIEYDSKFTWQVHLRHLNEYEYDAELVNSLWQAVKSIL